MIWGTIVKGKEIFNAFGWLKNSPKINMVVGLTLESIKLFLRRTLCIPKYGSKIRMGSLGKFYSSFTVIHCLSMKFLIIRLIR